MSRKKRRTAERRIYRKTIKLILIGLQAASAFALAWCLLSIGFWMEDSYSLRELSGSYEESELFFHQVDLILKRKIAAQDNEMLFEVDGAYCPEKEIDIQAYGKSGNAVKDLNTTYLLSDLIAFYQSGDWQKLHTAVQASMTNANRQEAGEALNVQAEKLETIRPVTGISLSECSRWYSDPAGFVLNMYSRLDEVCEDIFRKYQVYSAQQDESWSRRAPSNLRYCILNTATNELYTNVAAESYEQAAELIARDEASVTLCEGERSFDIMVTNPESVLNEEAEEWFINERFVGTGERVLIAVDQNYPVGDGLKAGADYFAGREMTVWISVCGAIASAVLLAGAFCLSLAGAGWEEGKLAPKLYWIDRLPTELAAGLYVVLAVLLVWELLWHPIRPSEIYDSERLLWAAGGAAAWMTILSACTGFVRRLRAHLLWHNSICRMLLHTWKKVTAARAASGQLLFFYIIFFILNFLFLLLFGKIGIFLVLVLDMAVLLYLLRDMAGKQSVWEGIHRISDGDLTYKIDTTALTGETYEMAKAVNEMGDGLQRAVESIVKNERLKAELITNVSHDLKTPLTSIVNYVKLLQMENLQGERVQHYIEVLDQKSQRLRQLTEDLVEVSKISSGNVELHMSRLQVQSMLAQAYGEFEERLEEKQLTASWELPKDPVFILADGGQFWRILENLLGNICKYACPGTQIDIRLRVQDGEARMELKNISGEELSVAAGELMGRFVRGDRSRNTEGSGLGLSIAQSLTELQNGRFELETAGRVFVAKLSFPIVDGDEA